MVVIIGNISHEAIINMTIVILAAIPLLSGFACLRGRLWVEKTTNSQSTIIIATTDAPINMGVATLTYIKGVMASKAPQTTIAMTVAPIQYGTETTSLSD